MKLATRITTALVVSLSLAGCGGETPAVGEPAIDTAAERGPASPPPAPASPSPAADPCGLLSIDELRQATGIAFAQGKVTANEPDLARCAWVPSDSAQGGIAVAVHGADPNAVWKRYFAMPGTQGVAGIGDEALVNTSMQHFVARRGDRVLVVNLNLPQQEIRRAGEEIARIVLPRIGATPSQ